MLLLQGIVGLHYSISFRKVYPMLKEISKEALKELSRKFQQLHHSCHLNVSRLFHSVRNLPKENILFEFIFKLNNEKHTHTGPLRVC